MIRLLFLLLLSACLGQAGAQQAEADAGAAPARQTLPDRTQTASGEVSCPHCNPGEQLVVDLIYYKQVLDILEQIDQQRNRINAGLLRSFHAELLKARPGLAALLKTDAETKPRETGPPPKKARKPAKKPARTVKKPTPRQGIDGLIVGHVNEENSELGIKPSVVLVSNGRPRSLNVGGVIEHNRRRYKVLKVGYVEDSKNGPRHEVHLQEQNSKKVHIVPWK